MSSKTYIHYGSDVFDMEKFNSIKDLKRDNRGINKPDFGLWASPVDTDFGWKDWCEGEEFHLDRLDKRFTFTLSEDAKILTVRGLDDVKDYTSYIDERITLFKVLDFDRIMRRFDGMELIHEDRYSELHDSFFYTWDCDSIVIWNPQVLQLL